MMIQANFETFLCNEAVTVVKKLLKDEKFLILKLLHFRTTTYLKLLFTCI